jgi:hypothetical protein
MSAFYFHLVNFGYMRPEGEILAENKPGDRVI